LEAGTVGVSIDATATLPDESLFILQCAYNDLGVFVDGITQQDNEAYFLGNQGLRDTRAFIYPVASGLTTATTIAAANTWTLAALVTTERDAAETQRFTHAANRWTYTGAKPRVVGGGGTFSASGTNGDELAVAIVQNGVTTGIDDVATTMTLNAGGRIEGGALTHKSTLVTGDYLEVWVKNLTASRNVTITSINLPLVEG